MSRCLPAQSSSMASTPVIVERKLAMWRAFFLALGAYCCLLGVEAMAVERAVLKVDPQSTQAPRWREINPSKESPWIMMTSGAVVMLYSFTIPQRVGKG